MIQGLEVGTHLGQVIQPSDNCDTDVLIVGAGPAGIAAALSCKTEGLRPLIIEQSEFGGAIAHYPRQKVVMTDKVRLPGAGTFGAKKMSKEALIEQLTKIREQARLEVKEKTRVNGIEGTDGAFIVQTTQGLISAQKVVLATGRRGSPKKLGVVGEERPKVTYALTEPEQYRGQPVVVVGGGDSAMEAALRLHENGAHITLVYHRARFQRGRAENRDRIHALISQESLPVLFEAQVREIHDHSILIEQAGRRVTLPNAFVFVCIGGELPTQFLSQVGVHMERHHGDRAINPPTKNLGTPQEEAQKDRRLTRLLTVFGLAIIGLLLSEGGEYYWMSDAERMRSPLHDSLRSSGLWGNGVGIVATVFMLSNFIYPIRKRFKLLKGTAPIRRWLTFHMFVGLMSPIVIVFHAAFRFKNAIATSTALALGIVVGTGLIGRYIYSLVPRDEGRVLSLEELGARLERLKAHMRPLIHGRGATIQRLFQATAAPKATGSFFKTLAFMPFSAISTRGRLWHARALFPERAAYFDFRQSILQAERLRFQLDFHTGLQRLLGWWRILHVVLAVFLVVIMTAHIAVAIYLGYTWIF